LKAQLHNFSKIKNQKEVTQQCESRFSYFFCLVIEGSGSIDLGGPKSYGSDGSGFGSGLGSGSATLIAALPHAGEEGEDAEPLAQRRQDHDVVAQAPDQDLLS
jgi:hypothetical protein